MLRPRVVSAASGTVLALGMSWAAVDASADAALLSSAHSGSAHSHAAVARARREVLIIDARVASRRELFAAARRDVETFILDPGRDGVAQLTEILETRRGLAAVHLVAHGRSGALLLGASELSRANLDEHVSSLSRWFDATGAAHELRPDLLLFGCEVAAGEDGRAFVSRLAELTGADVAASTDVTGGEARGANWRLETASGRIEATLPIAPAIARAYPSTLDVYAVSSLADAGPGSLRQAILDANVHAGSDTIVFSTTCGGDGGTCSTDGSLTGVINIESHLPVTDDVSIIGPGRDVLALDGHLAPGHSDPRGILWAYGSSVDVIDVSISGLAFEHARANYSYGGGVTAYDARVSIRDCRFEDNRSAGAYGGGAILSYATELSVEDCEFRDNAADAYGGAISVRYHNSSFTTTIARSLFRENTSAYGGAIHVATGAILEATDCAMIDNVSSTLGGAVHSQGAVVLGNSTLSGNRSHAGSAIAVRDKGGIELVHVTVVSAQAPAPDAGAPGGASALYFAGTEPGSSILSDSIVWGATHDLESEDADSAPIVRRTMFGVGTGPVVVEAGTVMGEDPLLLPLANLGGATPIHAIASTSPAIDRGTNPRAFPYDQRGTGFARVKGGAADLGAFEFAPAEDPGTSADAGTTTDAGTSIDPSDNGGGCAAAGAEPARSTTGLGALLLATIGLFRRRRR